MNIDAKEKMFSKGSLQEKDADGRPKMEKVGFLSTAQPNVTGSADIAN